MNLAHTLTQSALKFPGKTALVFEGRRWTYAQWNRWVNKAAHAFRALGLLNVPDFALDVVAAMVSQDDPSELRAVPTITWRRALDGFRARSATRATKGVHR